MFFEMNKLKNYFLIKCSWNWLFEDLICITWTDLEVNLVQKFLVEFKVVLWIQMCWVISNRVQNIIKKDKKVPHQILFQIAYVAHLKNGCMSSEKPFCLNRSKKQHFFGRKHFFFVEKQKKHLKSNSDVSWWIGSCWTFCKHF